MAEQRIMQEIFEEIRGKRIAFNDVSHIRGTQVKCPLICKRNLSMSRLKKKQSNHSINYRYYYLS